MTAKCKDEILKQLGGLAEETYDRLLADFKKQAEKQVENLHNCFLKNDKKKMSAIIHSIKGTGANLRLGNLLEIVHKLEKSVKQNADSTIMLQYIKNLKEKVCEIK
jgi:HPt (histidine-containing phosphotransfer) domain-containing protein